MKIAFRPLMRADLPLLLAWHHAPHASPWFDHEPHDLAGTECEYGPAIDGEDATRMHAIVIDEKPIGYMQHYLLSAYPEYQTALGIGEAVGIDYIIGDASYVGRGLGATIIRAYVDEIVRIAHPEVPTVCSSPSPENTRSLRALERAGFVALRTVIVNGEEERLCALSLPERR